MNNIYVENDIINSIIATLQLMTAVCDMKVGKEIDIIKFEEKLVTTSLCKINRRKTETMFCKVRESIFTTKESEIRNNIVAEWVVEYVEILALYETKTRREMLRHERVARDLLYIERAMYFRENLMTAPHKATRTLIWPKLSYMPDAVDYPKKDYIPTTPKKSSIKSSSSGSVDSVPRMPSMRSADNLEFCRLEIDGQSSSDDVSSYGRRCVTVTDNITVQSGPTVEESYFRECSDNWKRIADYTHIKGMIVASLRDKYGRDSTYDEGWTAYMEHYQFIDEIYCDVKDTYQKIFIEETIAWTSLQENHLDEISKLKKLGVSWWFL